MKKSLFFITILLATSCYNNREFYSLTFNNSSVNEVYNALKRFSHLINKMGKVYYHYDDSGDIIIGRSGASDSCRYMTFQNKVILNYKELGRWNSIRDDTSLLYSVSELKNFTTYEKKEFWNLFQFLIDNEINGTHVGGGTISFPFRQYPFANRHYMYIIFETDFNHLSEEKKNFMLENQLIIDKKSGLLLIISNKSRFLRYIYGSDDDVPEKWKQPTKEVFDVL